MENLFFIGLNGISHYKQHCVNILFHSVVTILHSAFTILHSAFALFQHGKLVFYWVKWDFPIINNIV